jgi:hypothetical protein
VPTYVGTPSGYHLNTNTTKEGTPVDETNKILDELLFKMKIISFESLTEGTLPELAQRLDMCQSLTSVLKYMTDALQEDIAARMEDDSTTITGVGVVQRKAKTSSTWIDDTSRERMMEDSIRAIIRRVAVDPATGEMHAPLANVAREVWRLTQDSFSFTADPKSAFRKVLGLAPDEYRSKRVTGYTVAIAPITDEGTVNVSQ